MGKREQKRMRAGVIGAGHMGQYHILVYAELWDVDLVGIVDVGRRQGGPPRRAVRFAGAHRLPGALRQGGRGLDRRADRRSTSRSRRTAWRRASACWWRSR